MPNDLDEYEMRPSSDEDREIHYEGSPQLPREVWHFRRDAISGPSTFVA